MRSNRDYYDEFAAWYERERGRGYHDMLDELEADIVLRHGRAARVLEAGCGTGLVLERLRAGAPNAVGIDLSRGMLGQARRRGLPVMQADLLRLPFPDGAFDTVVSVRMLTHCRRWEEFIAELCRVARRAVIVDYPTSESANRIAPALFGAKKKLEGNTRLWRLFRHREVEEAFAAAGFAIAGRRPQFFLPMVVHRILRLLLASKALEGAAAALGLTRRWGSPVIVEARRVVASQRTAEP